MEVSLLSGGTKHSLQTVRVLHETVLALKSALEGSRKELSELRSRFHDEGAVRDRGSMDNGDHKDGHACESAAVTRVEREEEGEEEEEAFGKRDSGGESEDIDDIELVFTTGETDPGAMHDDMVPICDEVKTKTHTVLVETDISKCGVIDENDTVLGSRRNTLPDPPPYRPIIHREVLSAARTVRGSPRKVRAVGGDKTKQETGAQTDITAVPALWKSETYLAHKISCTLTTLPSKFTLPVPRANQTPLSDKARRGLLSDINFTSMVPELSRSADHLHQDEDGLGACRNPTAAVGYVKSCESGWEGKIPETGRHGSRSSWGSRFQTSVTSVATEEPRRRHSCRVPIVCCTARHSWSSVPSFRCHPCHNIVRSNECTSACHGRRSKARAREHHCCSAGQSMPDLRPECDSGESTDSLIDEAEDFLRRSIDNMMLPKTKKKDRRHSEPNSTSGMEVERSAQPFLPKSPNDLKQNYLVKIITADGRIVLGQVRYAGQVAGKTEPYVGVELQSNTGGSDGTFLNHRYFDCKPDHAIFVPFKKVVLAWCT